MTAGTTLGMDMIYNNQVKNCKFDLSDDNTLNSECVRKLLDCKNPEELYHCMINQDLPVTVNDAKYIFNEVSKYKRELLNALPPKDEKVSKLFSDNLETIIGGYDVNAAEKDFDLKKNSGTKNKKAAYYISRPTYYVGYGVGATAKCIPLVPIVIKSMVLGFKDQLFGISD